MSFHLLNFSGTNGAIKQVNLVQEAVEQSAIINLSNETRFDPNGSLDHDDDGVLDTGDNCPTNYNPSQLNTDDELIITMGIGPSDLTIPNDDGLGDVCDADDDNDGISDELERLARACLGGHQTVELVFDTDGDRVGDGAECILGSDPLDANAKPPVVLPDTDADGLDDAFENNNGFNPNSADSDGDGINDGIEFKGYNTSPLSGDTDSDGCSDNLEITSVDANQAVNSLDLLIVALSFNQTDRPNPDINKNGIVNATDLLIVALNFATAACNTPD